MANSFENEINELSQQINKGTNPGALKKREWRERAAAALGVSEGSEDYEAVVFLSDDDEPHDEKVIAVAEKLAALGYLNANPDGKFAGRFPQDSV